MAYKSVFSEQLRASTEFIENIYVMRDETTKLPCLQLYPMHSPNLVDFGVIFGHGLGSKNPHKKHYFNDEWALFFSEVCSKINLPVALYTARGHGNSDGWEATAFSNPEQFTWNQLANDMHDVATNFGYHHFIAGGSSMGSATALYTAIRYPDRVCGVVMIRPPTAWESRRERRKYLLRSSEKLKLIEDSSAQPTLYHQVLNAAAFSDLPSIETDIDLYKSISCPVLILTIEGDDAHPVSTAEALHSVLCSSKLYIAANEGDAIAAWPLIIQQFIEKEILMKDSNRTCTIKTIT